VCENLNHFQAEQGAFAPQIQADLASTLCLGKPG
jgi:hypothetical protein